MKMTLAITCVVLTIAGAIVYVAGERWERNRQRQTIALLTRERDSLRRENSKLTAERIVTMCVAPEGSTPVLQTSFRDESTHTDRTVVIFARSAASSEPPFGIRVCETGKEPVVVDTRTADEAFSLLEGRTPRPSSPRRMDWRRWSRTH